MCYGEQRRELRTLPLSRNVLQLLWGDLGQFAAVWGVGVREFFVLSMVGGQLGLFEVIWVGCSYGGRAGNTLSTANPIADIDG
jgi:hypothetical protein